MSNAVMSFSLLCDELESPKMIGCCNYPFDYYSDDRMESLLQTIAAKAFKYAKDKHVEYSVNTDINQLSFVVRFIPEPVNPDNPVGPVARANKITTGMMGYLFNLLHFEYLDYRGSS